MTSDTNLPRSQTPSQPAPAPAQTSPVTEQKPARVTRASAVWVATSTAILLLVLLIIFILQNSRSVEVHLLGFAGSVPLGMALFIAAVGGGLAVTIAGIARVTQLRMNVRRAKVK